MRTARRAKWERPVLILIIVLQIVTMIFVGFQKQEYHIDEIYSYILSNSYNTDAINHADEMWNRQISGDDFHNFVTVQKGERFAYDKVYRNTSLDCHPPLYYWLLHTICSFAPDQFSKWYGLGLNIALFAAAMIFVYLTFCELTHDSKWRLIPVVLYGFSSLAIDTATFIRMYMLLTLFTLIFVYLHARMFHRGVTIPSLIMVWVVIYLGAMTQYYSAIVSFWGVLFFAAYLLFNKQIKEMFLYGLGACASIGAMFLSYPYVVEQVTGSSTNNVGNEVMKNLFNFQLWKDQTKALRKSLVRHLTYHADASSIAEKVILALLAIGLIVYLITCIRKKSFKSLRKLPAVLWLIGISVCTFLSVTFIGGEYVYLRYIYYIVPVIYIAFCALMSFFLRRRKVVSVIALAVAVVFAIGNMAYGTIHHKSEYLFEDKLSHKEALKPYTDRDLYIIVGDITKAVPTGNLTKLQMFDSIYMAPMDDILQPVNMVAATLNDKGSCVVFIRTDQYWGEGLDAEAALDEILKDQNAEYEKITKADLGVFYDIHLK